MVSGTKCAIWIGSKYLNLQGLPGSIFTRAVTEHPGSMKPFKMVKLQNIL